MLLSISKLAAITFFAGLVVGECWTNPKVGCSKSGYCYRICRYKPDFPGWTPSGDWCWTRDDNDWKKCTKDSECNGADPCAPDSWDEGGCGGCT
ncbi:hypothetical protein GGS20DRAFT_573398 [Poronia punctata]|nr:hypothetical protein GGS20DRAFT_573398 [Poronia punctata]